MVAGEGKILANLLEKQDNGTYFKLVIDRDKVRNLFKRIVSLGINVFLKG